MNVQLASPAPLADWAGRAFVSRSFDYLFIGGGLSLLAIPAVLAYERLTGGSAAAILPPLLLLSSAAHFAASTVRLYTKPGARQDMAFLTMALPLLSIAVLFLAVLSPSAIGAHLQALYLTWSPFHYSAQAFGLAVMYCYRSGCRLSEREKNMLWWVAMVPFARAFLGGTHSGLAWFVSRDTIMALPVLPSVLNVVTQGLAVLTFVLPAALVLSRIAKRQQPLPAIVPCLLIANGVWWVVLDYLNAFVWATIFHGIQYLAIAAIFHVKDRTAEDGNRHGAAYHAAWFYGASLALGYALFYCWPYAFRLAGFGQAESMLLVIAVINVHHFIVDRYIWRLGRDRNARHLGADGHGRLAEAGVA
jgi:hypothetical protein